jgi:hypothetical protein
MVERRKVSARFFLLNFPSVRDKKCLILVSWLKQTTSYMVIKISPVFSLALVQEEGVTANFDEL